MPKREIQVERKASAHEDEEMEERGVASSQRVVLSIIVRMCEHPWEVGRGPTMSTWTWDMVVDFCFLTRNAFFCPLIYISGHVGPNKTGRNEAAGGLDARVA